MGKETPTYKDGTRLTVRLQDGTEGAIEVLQSYFLPDGTEVLYTYPDCTLCFERKKDATIWTAGAGSTFQEVEFIRGGQQNKTSDSTATVGPDQAKSKCCIRRSTS